MPLDPQAKRRCAALAVFTPVLDEDALMDALWLLHEAMRGDTIRDIIGAVDRVGQRHGLDARTCKRLYEGFYRALHLPEEELPLDPWPAMLAVRPELAEPPARVDAVVAAIAASAPPAPAPPPPAVTPAVTPANWAPAAAAMAAAAASQPPPASAAAAGLDPDTATPAAIQPDRPAHVQVFAALMKVALADVRQLHASDMDDLRASAIAALDQARLPPSIRQVVREAWQQGVQSSWQIDLPAKGLAELIHAFYVALCETLGPIDADHVLTRAVKQCELVPAARHFSPKQFL